MNKPAGTDKKPEAPKTDKRTISQFIRLSKKGSASPLRISDCVVFFLQVLSFPPQYLTPTDLMKAITCCVGRISLFLRYEKLKLRKRPRLLFDYLFFFAEHVTSEKILFIHLNTSANNFKDFMLKLKAKLIKLIYLALSLDLKKKIHADRFLLWVHYLITAKFIKEEELFDIIKLKIPKDIAEYAKKKQYKAKYLAKEEKKVMMPLHEEKKSVDANEYNGKNVSTFKEIMAKLKKKSEAQIPTNLEVFHDLLFRLSFEENQRAYFAQPVDYFQFRKSTTYALLEYFYRVFGLFHQYKNYITLWDIIRLSYSFLAEKQKNQLKEILEETFKKVEISSYRYNIPLVRECFALAEKGKIILDEGDEAINIPPSNKKGLYQGSSSHTIEEFSGLLETFSQDLIVIEDVYEELDRTIYESKIEEHPISDAVLYWLNQRFAQKSYYYDSWKRERKLICLINVLNYFSPKEYEIISSHLMKALDNFGEIMKINKGMILLSGIQEGKLTVGCSLESIDEFIKENPAIIKGSFDKFNEVAKEIYEKQKPGNDRYDLMNRTIRRISDALKNNTYFQNVEFRFKVYGSAANTFWTSKSDIDISLVIEKKMLEAPMKFLEKAEYAIKKANIGSTKLIPAFRIPIIKYTDELTKIQCDINSNNLLGVANSSLLAAYATLDQRFHILGFLVKEFAKINKIQGGDMSYLTSYAYLNMMIQYLQLVKPPVLPSLQKLFLSSPRDKEVNIKYPVPAKLVGKEEFPEEDAFGGDKRHGIFESMRDIKMDLVPANVYFEQDLLKVRDHMQQTDGINKMTVPELFAGFLRYYLFDFKSREKQISIKEGHPIDKKEQDGFLFSMEDPFDTYHNPGKTLKMGTVEATRTTRKFMKMYLALLQGFKILELDDE